MRFLNAAALLLLLAFASIGQSKQQGEPSISPEKKVCVVGDVTKPSLIPFTKGLTVAGAVKEAGGIPIGSKQARACLFAHYRGCAQSDSRRPRGNTEKALPGF